MADCGHGEMDRVSGTPLPTPSGKVAATLQNMWLQP